ncbi:MAG: hypothetical protein P4N59_23410 [Negativicutes bacterium]|nr:hypothetical protein [Negativicutes bacterium]
MPNRAFDPGHGPTSDPTGRRHHSIARPPLIARLGPCRSMQALGPSGAPTHRDTHCSSVSGFAAMGKLWWRWFQWAAEPACHHHHWEVADGERPAFCESQRKVAGPNERPSQLVIITIGSRQAGAGGHPGQPSGAKDSWWAAGPKASRARASQAQTNRWAMLCRQWSSELSCHQRQWEWVRRSTFGCSLKAIIGQMLGPVLVGGIYRGFKSALLGEANGCLVRVVLPVSECRCFPVASQIKS